MKTPRPDHPHGQQDPEQTTGEKLIVIAALTLSGLISLSILYILIDFLLEMP